MALDVLQNIMERYLGNRNDFRVHDLLAVQRSCETELIEIEHRELFEALRDAHIAGYHDCQICLPKGRKIGRE